MKSEYRKQQTEKCEDGGVRTRQLETGSELRRQKPGVWFGAAATQRQASKTGSIGEADGFASKKWVFAHGLFRFASWRKMIYSFPR
jgi:hypothetical protein